MDVKLLSLLVKVCYKYRNMFSCTLFKPYSFVSNFAENYQQLFALQEIHVINPASARSSQRPGLNIACCNHKTVE